MDRRNFIKTLGIAGGAMLLNSSVGAPAVGAADSRKNSASDPRLAGVCDIHIHCLPDTRPRCIDEFTLAEQAKQAGYRAVMYKSNDWSCHDRAYLIRQALPDFEVFGSLCMNRVHGDKVNAYARYRRSRPPAASAAASGCRPSPQLISINATNSRGRESRCLTRRAKSCRK